MLWNHGLEPAERGEDEDQILIWAIGDIVLNRSFSEVKYSLTPFFR